MSPDSLDRLKDEMTVRLLEATSSDTALQRVRIEVGIGYPVYDPDPQSNLRHLQPRDVIKRCGVCACLFVQQQHTSGPLEHLYCSRKCSMVGRQRVFRARRAAQRRAS